jgi:large subunit ribosomal protein L9
MPSVIILLFMKVILLQNIEDLGKKYDVKEVKNGHARNFLIPQNLVKPATKENLNWLVQQKSLIEKKAEDDLKQAQELASKIDGLEVLITMVVGEHGEVFESVNTAKVAEKLKEMGYEVKKSQIKLTEPIKAIGEFPVKINLDHNLEAEIQIIISGTSEGGSKEVA